MYGEQLDRLRRRVAGSAYFFVASLAFAACVPSPEKQPSRLEAAFDSFDRYQATVLRSDATSRTTASRIHDRYRTVFKPYQRRTMIAKLGNDDMVLLFRAADADFFYTILPTSLDDMRLDLGELRRRGIARDSNYEKVYAALLESRLFGQAHAFAKLHPLASAQTVPNVADVTARNGPTALLVKDGGKQLERTSVDLRKGSTIVVVSSPLCHFSQRAIGSIENDAVLRPLFRKHTVWVVPPDQSTSFLEVAKWNRVHPDEQMEVAYRRDEWPMVDRWETPVFYFVKDGRVVSKVTGWPKSGRKAEVRRSLRVAGLL